MRLNTTPVSSWIYTLILSMSICTFILVYHASAKSIDRPLFVNPDNPRYFTNGAKVDGKYQSVYLTGSHTWNNPQSATYDWMNQWAYQEQLSFAKRQNHNFIRMWILEHTQDAEAKIHPHPWQRTGPSKANDGLPKFDLKQFDRAYFDRLRQRIIQARDQGIYVSVMFFDDWSTELQEPWRHHPFNAANNINNIHADSNRDGLGVEFHTKQNPEILALQEAYVHHVIDTVNDLDNVIYEVGNEIGISKDWQYHMIRVIKDYEKKKAKQHPVGMTVGYPVLEVNNAACFQSDAEWISPNKEGDYDSNPPAATGEKVVIVDTDHLWGVGGDGSWVWKSFTRGLNPIFMDKMEQPGPGWTQQARSAMGQTLAYANRMNLTATKPSGDLTSTGFALVNPGVEYLVYQPTSGDFTVKATTGTYRYEWFSPKTNQVVRSGSMKIRDHPQRFTPPFTETPVLYLKRA